MPSNLPVLLVLVAGYLFYRICYYTRFRAQSLDGYRLLFRCTVIGLVFFTVARVLILALNWEITLVARFWTDQISNSPWSGTAVLCVLLSVVLALLINIPVWEVWRRAFLRRRLKALVKRRLRRYFDLRKSIPRNFWYTHLAVWDSNVWFTLGENATLKKQIALNWSTLQHKSHFLILLNQTAASGELISVTLKNRKYYIGAVKEAPSLDPNETWFRLYPVKSGYRDKDKLTLEETTDYQKIQQDKQDDPVSVILPIAEVEIASRFDPDLYAKYFERRPGPGATIADQ